MYLVLLWKSHTASIRRCICSGNLHCQHSFQHCKFALEFFNTLNKCEVFKKWFWNPQFTAMKTELDFLCKYRFKLYQVGRGNIINCPVQRTDESCNFFHNILIVPKLKKTLTVHDIFIIKHIKDKWKTIKWEYIF